jgi:nucleoside-diphosphate-sugar epimerase
VARILVTGAYGNVGRSTVEACLEAGDEVSILEAEGARNRRLGARLAAQWRKRGHGRCREAWHGDVRDPRLCALALAGQDAVIHLAALIPPAADRRPDLATSINVEGTRCLLEATREAGRTRAGGPATFVLASSIAAYGDRLRDFWIRREDPLAASPGDAYAASKIEAEALVRASGIPFSILRLSYIVWREKLQRDPLMFHMPLDTRLEICHTEDTGRAFAAAARAPEALGATFDIGGGESCRTSYRDYLDAMLRLFGLGGIGTFGVRPELAFARDGFHCGWYADSDEAERVLRFRRKTLADYYVEVAEEAAWKRLGATLLRPLARAALAARSPFLRARGGRDDRGAAAADRRPRDGAAD